MMISTGRRRNTISTADRVAVPILITLIVACGLLGSRRSSAQQQPYRQHSVNNRTKETVLYAFKGSNDGENPQGPSAPLLVGHDGSVYGTTLGGGEFGLGTVFKLDKKGHETILHSFIGSNSADGAWPMGQLAIAADGNLYGVTWTGGAYYSGTIYRLSTDGKGDEIVLYAFRGGADGATPSSGIIRDAAGNLYGATYGGGAYGSGVLFKLGTGGQLTVLYNFGAKQDDGTAVLGLTRDARGNFYAASMTGGPSRYSQNCIQVNHFVAFGCGSIAKIDPKGHETFIHIFSGIHGDGGSPVGPVSLDETGNIYGTTLLGGTGSCQPIFSSTPGCGTIFKIDAAGKYTVIYSFPGIGRRGAGAIGGLVLDSSHNLYGTTEAGGLAGCPGGYYTSYSGCGLMFTLSASGKQTVLYKFTGGKDGGNPESGMVPSSAGSLLGTGFDGGNDYACSGHGCGVVFESPK